MNYMKKMNGHDAKWARSLSLFLRKEALPSRGDGRRPHLRCVDTSKPLHYLAFDVEFLPSKRPQQFRRIESKMFIPQNSDGPREHQGSTGNVNFLTLCCQGSWHLIQSSLAFSLFLFSSVSKGHGGALFPTLVTVRPAVNYQLTGYLDPGL